MLRRFVLTSEKLGEKFSAKNVPVLNVIIEGEPFEGLGTAMPLPEIRPILNVLGMSPDGPLLQKVYIDVEYDDDTGRFNGNMQVTKTAKNPVADPIALMRLFDQGPIKRLRANTAALDSTVDDEPAP